MRSAVMVIAVGVLLVEACGGGEDRASETSAESQRVEIRTSVIGAATPGAEPIATGDVLDGPPLAGRPSVLAGPSWTPTEAMTPRCR